jgi:hypothetical protein
MAMASKDREGAALTDPDYRAFLLRCWQEPGAGAGGVPAWRFVLVQLDGKEVKRGFASLKELYAHLGRTLGGAP